MRKPTTRLYVCNIPQAAFLSVNRDVSIPLNPGGIQTTEFRNRFSKVWFVCFTLNCRLYMEYENVFRYSITDMVYGWTRYRLRVHQISRK